MNSFLAMFWKELIQVSNRARFAVQRSLLVLGMSAFLAFMAWDVVYRQGMDEGGFRYQAMASFGRNFFLIAAGLFMIVLPLAAMVFASAIVASETVRKRLPLLLVTPLGSGAIVGSKAASVFTRVTLGFFVAALPLMAILQLFGGVDSTMVITAAVLIVANVWLYASLGLAVSVLNRTVAGAISWAAVLTVAWNVAPFMVDESLSRGSIPPSSLHILDLSPLYVFVRFADARLLFNQLAFHVGVNFCIGALLLAWAFAAFRPMAIRHLSGAPKRRAANLVRNWIPRGKKGMSSPSALSGWFGTGVISKELASWRVTRVLLPLVWFAGVWAMAILSSILSPGGSMFSDREFHEGMFFVEAVGFLFLLANYASVRIAGEKEAMTFQTLALTPLGAVRILSGKAAAVLIEQSLPIGLLSLHLGLVLLLGSAARAPMAQTVGLVAGLVISMLYSVVMGLYFSLSAKKVSEAIVATSITWFLGVFVMILLVEVAGSAIDPSPWIEVILGTVGILCVLAWLVFALVRSARRGVGSFIAYLSYAAVSAALLLLVLSGRETSMEVLYSYASILPAASVIPWQWSHPGVSAMVLPVQAGVLAWMAVMSLAQFAAQARRAS